MSRPLTHTQYRDADGTTPCRAGEHHFVWDDDDDDGPVVCTRCGMSDIEPET